MGFFRTLNRWPKRRTPWVARSKPAALPAALSGFSTACDVSGPFQNNIDRSWFPSTPLSLQGTTWGNTVTLRAGVAFTPTANYSVTDVTFRLDGPGAGFDQAKIDIYATSGGKPTGASLGSSTPRTLGFAADNCKFVFPTPVPVTSGVTYAAVVSRTGAQDGANAYDIHETTSGGIAVLLTEDSGGVWSTNAGLYPLFWIGTDKPTYWAIGRDATSATTLRAIGAVNPATSWPMAVIKTGFTTSITSIFTRQWKNTLHIVLTDGVTNYKYQTFDMSTGQFVTSETIASGLTIIGAGQASCVVRQAQPAGEVVVFYNAAAVSSHGRVSYSRRTAAATWSAATAVDPGSPATDDFQNPSSVLGAFDRVHFMYVDNTNGTGYHRSLDNSNALDTNLTQTTTTPNGVMPVSYQTGATTWKVQNSNQAGSLAEMHFDSGANPAIGVQAITQTGRTPSSPHRTYVDVDEPTYTYQASYIVYVDSVNNDIYASKSTDHGVTWTTTPITIYTGTAATGGLNYAIGGVPYVRGGNVVLPFIFVEGGVHQYYEYTLRSAALAKSIDATSPGSYLLSAPVATLVRHGWKMVATTPASYAVTGSNVSLRQTLIATTAGSYAVTGAATTKTLHAWRLIAGTIGGAAGTWDPSAVGSGCSLSNGNLSVECTGTVVNNVTKATPFQSSGKYYYEFTIDQALDNSVVGLANAATALTEYLGQNTSHSMGIFNGNWLGATSGTTTAPAFVTGHVYGIAIDITNKLAWAKDITAAGNWNANATADPVTGVNGASFSTVTGNIYPATSLINANDKITINFGASAYTGSLPSGYSNWATATPTYALTGTAAVVRKGYKLVATTAGSYALTGSNVGLAKALVAGTASYTLTGQPATLTKAKWLVAGTASYTLTGVNQTLTYRRLINATTAGAYSLIGSNVKLSKALVAGTASYTLTGTAVGVLVTRKLNATTPASYVLTGTAARLAHGWVVNAQTAGSYTLTGQPVGLVKPTAKVIVAVPGVYTLTGTDAGFKRTYVLQATAGSYALTGTAALLRKGYVVTATTASYALTGTPATLRHGWVINVTSPGNYALTGAATTKVLHGWRIAAGVASYALTGQSVKLSQALTASAGSYTLTGTATTKLTKGKILVVGVASYALTGQPVNTIKGKVLTAGVASYTLTGQTVKLSQALTASAGSYALTGAATTKVLHGWRIAAGVASYALTGQPAGVLHGWRLNATTAGSYALTGQPVNLVRAAHGALIADPGSYLLTGQPVNLLKQAHPVIVAGVGSYLLTGQTARLARARLIAANTNSYALTGSPVTLRRGWKIPATAGSYALTGTDALVRRGRNLLATTAGSYLLTGQPVTMSAKKILFPDLYLDPDQFFTHNIKYNQTLVPGLFLDPDQFFNHNIDTFYGDTEVMYVPEEIRRMVLDTEDRLLEVVSEGKSMEILAEDRTMYVPVQPRETDADRGMEVLDEETMMQAPVRRRA